METVKCQNLRIESSTGRQVPCGRILAILTDQQISVLKTDPEKKSIFRCPKCPPQDRWVSIKFNGDKLIFSVEDGSPRGLDKSLQFDDYERTEQAIVG